MTPDYPERGELTALLHALCEETITPEQVARLEAIVLARPEAEADYIRAMSLHADLVRHVRGLPQPVTPAPRARGRVVRAVLALAALAAGVLLVHGLLHRPRPDMPPAPTPAAEPTDDSVAVLLQTHRAEWDAAGMVPRPGAPLRPGRLVLRSGSAQIEFYSGATVVLTGPADLKLVSRSEAYCAGGKLRATVPAAAQGFTVRSPKFDLVDRSTEFGLDVGDRTEVHVFQGKVDLYDPAARKKGPRTELTTGQGVSLDGAAGRRPIPTNPAAFLTAGELAARTEAEIEQRRREWTDASRALRADPGVALYYPFEPNPASPRTVPDVARGRALPRDGAVVGCAWGAGRWRGKAGLEFKQVSDRVRVRVPGEFASLTLAAWVRPDALPNQNNALFMADGWDPGGPHWQIGSDGSLVLGVRAPEGYPIQGKGASYKAPEVLTPDRFGRWVHLAVVYDRDRHEVVHYLDGRPVGQAELQFDIPLRVGDAEIGNWNPASYRVRSPVRNFTGGIDEFLLFSRPLTGPEVESLYAQGRPPP
jgi:hypothetical protein